MTSDFSSSANRDALSWHFQSAGFYSGQRLSWLRAIWTFVPLGFSCRSALVLLLLTWVWQCQRGLDFS